MRLAGRRSRRPPAARRGAGAGRRGFRRRWTRVGGAADRRAARRAGPVGRHDGTERRVDRRRGTRGGRPGRRRHPARGARVGGHAGRPPRADGGSVAACVATRCRAVFLLCSAAARQRGREEGVPLVCRLAQFLFFFFKTAGAVPSLSAHCLASDSWRSSDM